MNSPKLPIHIIESVKSIFQITPNINNSSKTLRSRRSYPSRTILINKIDPDNVQLWKTMSEFGEVQSIIEQKRGSMVSFYDIRSAILAFDNLPETQFWVSQDIGANLGTIVVFGLDKSISDIDLQNVFSKCGDIYQIRSTPNKTYHRFIEFYDLRNAQLALDTMNYTTIKGKKIKIEFSRVPHKKSKKKLSKI